jgi:hypothetical protein
VTTKFTRGTWILAILLLALVFLLFAPPIAQDESYHLFEDNRTFFHIANFWNVVSNLPFLVVGAIGLMRSHRPAAWALCVGILLTGIGSSFYHLAPSDSRLVWDRLPMTLAFMGLVADFVGEQKDFGRHLWVLPSLISLGFASIVLWQFTGDLRLYAVVQFGSVLILLQELFVEGPERRLLGVGIGMYVLAKCAEYYDASIYSALRVSGHTFKHIMAAAACWAIVQWRVRETPGDGLQPPTSPECAKTSFSGSSNPPDKAVKTSVMEVNL